MLRYSIRDMLCMNLKKGGTGGISSKEHQEIFSIAGNLKLNDKSMVEKYCSK